MRASTCVAYGECVQACSTGALMPATALDTSERAGRHPSVRRIALTKQQGSYGYRHPGVGLGEIAAPSYR